MHATALIWIYGPLEACDRSEGVGGTRDGNPFGGMRGQSTLRARTHARRHELHNKAFAFASPKAKATSVSAAVVQSAIILAGKSAGVLLPSHCSRANPLAMRNRKMPGTCATIDAKPTAANGMRHRRLSGSTTRTTSTQATPADAGMTAQVKLGQGLYHLLGKRSFLNVEKPPEVLGGECLIRGRIHHVGGCDVEQHRAHNDFRMVHRHSVHDACAAIVVHDLNRLSPSPFMTAI